MRARALDGIADRRNQLVAGDGLLEDGGSAVIGQLVPHQRRGREAGHQDDLDPGVALAHRGGELQAVHLGHHDGAISRPAALPSVALHFNGGAALVRSRLATFVLEHNRVTLRHRLQVADPYDFDF